MKLGRRKEEPVKAVKLPDRYDTVTLTTPRGERFPARVVEREDETLRVAVLVPMKALNGKELKGTVLEYSNHRGRTRLRGEVRIEDPGQPDLLCVEGPHHAQVLQEREYVRIKSARPVIVYAGGDRLQMRSYTVDLSGGGFLLAGPDTLKVGEEVKFQLTIEQSAAPLTGKGRVVRTDAKGRRAVEFEGISDFDRRRLVRFIFDCQRAERARGLIDGES
jgi:c-di-GMP-binding flagellar brake protein YcgR